MRTRIYRISIFQNINFNLPVHFPDSGLQRWISSWMWYLEKTNTTRISQIWLNNAAGKMCLCLYEIPLPVLHLVALKHSLALSLLLSLQSGRQKKATDRDAVISFSISHLHNVKLWFVPYLVWHRTVIYFLYSTVLRVYFHILAHPPILFNFRLQLKCLQTQ